MSSPSTLQILYGGTAPVTVQPYNWGLVGTAIGLICAYILLQVKTNSRNPG